MCLFFQTTALDVRPTSLQTSPFHSVTSVFKLSAGFIFKKYFSRRQQPGKTRLRKSWVRHKIGAERRRVRVGELVLNTSFKKAAATFLLQDSGSDWVNPLGEPGWICRFFSVKRLDRKEVPLPIVEKASPVFWISFRRQGKMVIFHYYYLSEKAPDQPVHNLRATKSKDRLILSSSKTSIDGLRGFRNV